MRSISEDKAVPGFENQYLKYLSIGFEKQKLSSLVAFSAYILETESLMKLELAGWLDWLVQEL